MEKQRFTEEEIIGVLQEHVAGAKAADLLGICIPDSDGLLFGGTKVLSDDNDG